MNHEDAETRQRHLTKLTDPSDSTWVDDLLAAEHDSKTAQIHALNVRLAKAEGSHLEALKMEQLRLIGELKMVDAKIGFWRRHRQQQ